MKCSSRTVLTVLFSAAAMLTALCLAGTMAGCCQRVTSEELMYAVAASKGGRLGRVKNIFPSACDLYVVCAGEQIVFGHAGGAALGKDHVAREARRIAEVMDGFAKGYAATSAMPDGFPATPSPDGTEFQEDWRGGWLEGCGLAALERESTAGK